MRWPGPIVDRDDEFTPFLTAHLPVRVTHLRRTSLILVLAGFGIALGVVLHYVEQVQLAGLTAGEIVLYLLLIDLPTRRLHRFSRVGANYALVHVLATLALIAWTWLLPLGDAGPSAHGRRASVLGGLLGSPHPNAAGSYQAGAWLCAVFAVAAGVALHVRIHLLGRTWAGTPDS